MEEEPMPVDATDDAAAASAGSSGHVGHADGSSMLPRLVDGGWARHPTVLERYFTTHTTSNHQCVHVHSNGVCVLAVSPSHPMLQNSEVKVSSIAYRSHDSKNLMETAVRGKKKSGATFILPRDMVCTVTLSDGSTVTLYGCVRASVVEINTRLLEDPSLLGKPEGYIAILLPKMEEKRSIGEAVLEFDRQHPLNVESGNSKKRGDGRSERPSRSYPNKKAKTAAPPCWAFQKGECKYGDKCRFAHDGPGAVAPTGEGAPGASDGDHGASGASGARDGGEDGQGGGAAAAAGGGGSAAGAAAAAAAASGGGEGSSAASGSGGGAGGASCSSVAAAGETAKPSLEAQVVAAPVGPHASKREAERAAASLGR
jgi:hypothetical protein